MAAASRRRQRSSGKQPLGPRDRMIAAAGPLFARHGFQGVYPAMIAKAAGVTHPMVKYYFRDHEEIWQASVLALANKCQEGLPLEGLLFDDLKALDKLDWLIRLRAEMHHQEPNYGLIFIREALVDTDRLKWVIDSHLKYVFHVIDRIVGEALASKSIRALPQRDVSYILTASNLVLFAFDSVGARIHPSVMEDSAHLHALNQSFALTLLHGILISQEHGPPASSLGSPPVAPHAPPVESGSNDAARQKLLDVAGKLFARFGYDGVTTVSIAKEAGVAQSSIGYHFGTKDQLWDDVAETLVRKRRVDLPFTRPWASTLDPASQLKLFLRTLIQANIDNPEFSAIFTHEALTGGERLDRLVDQYVGGVYRLVENAGTAAMDEGVIKRFPAGHLSSILPALGILIPIIRAMAKHIGGTPFSREDLISLSDTLMTMTFQGLAMPEHSST